MRYKSHKAKLRPADVVPSSSFILEDSQSSSGSGSVGSCPRPFTGVILCATGVDKMALFKQAIELGAMCFNAFTDKVTHLVAADTGSAKYKCAVERRIPILHPSWITESHAIWLRGDDVDLHESIVKHRLPIFSGVVLCLTGISPLSRRTTIHKLLVEHGGTYCPTLTRPVTVTHLLCAGNETSDKIKYANKFNESGEANIAIVWEEWFWDSIEFGGRWDEERYLLTKDGARPEPRTLPVPDTVASQSTSLMVDAPSALDDEQASIARPPDIAIKLWNSLLKPRGLQVQGDGSMLRSPTKPKTIMEHAERNDDTSQPQSDDDKGKGKSVLTSSSFRRANSFVIVPSQPKPFLKSNPVAGPSRLLQGIFSNKTLLLLGDADTRAVRKAIKDAGGTPTDDQDTQVDFVIVRLLSGSPIYRQYQNEPALRSRWRTECWLEKCLHAERICEPEENIVFSPIGVETPITGAQDVRISFSGLDESEKCFMTRLTKALGMTHVATFTRHTTTHLLCPSRVGAKFAKANEWEIPVIDMSWIEAIVQTGVIPLTGTVRLEKEMKMVEITNDPQPTQTRTPSSHSASPKKMKTLVRAHTVAVLDSEHPPLAASPLRSQSAQCLNSSPVPLPPLIPSPCKAPPPPVTEEVTKALQDSIMNLFPADKKGKRKSDDGDDGDEEEDRDKKKLKSRPKPLGRHPSGRWSRTEDDDPTSDRELNLGGESVRESIGMRVRYEDPEQMGEKKKLMELLGNESQDKRIVVRRKSKRTPGF